MYLVRFATFFSAFVLGATLTHAQPKTFDEQVVERGAPGVEWTVENATYGGNPYDLRVRAIFTHEESGRTIETALFYQSDDVWAFRFTGARTGTWRIRTFSSDAELHGWTGTVEVEPANGAGRQGFITSFGPKWGWAGSGEAFVPQYVMGKPAEAYLTEKGLVDTVAIAADIEEFVVEHGFSGFHITVRGNWFDGENPNRRVYRVVEELIRRAYEMGGASHIWLWGGEGEGPESVTGEFLGGQDRRNLRYLAARLGPLPGWTLGFGFDTENGWVLPGQIADWKRYLESRLGWDHFLGARVGYDEHGRYVGDLTLPSPPTDAAHRSPVADKYAIWLGGDYTGYTSYRPLYPRYKEVLYHHVEEPTLEEDRYRLRNSDRWSYKDYWPELTRRGFWHSAMAGGVANIWGNLLPHSENELGSRPYDNGAKGHTGDRRFTVDVKHQIKTYARFFEDRFLKEMRTFYDGPELRLMVPGGTHAIVYREDTRRVRLNLRRLDEAQPVIALDTKKTYQEIEVGTLKPGEHTWKAPYRSDWAIAVGEY